MHTLHTHIKSSQEHICVVFYKKNLLKCNKLQVASMKKGFLDVMQILSKIQSKSCLSISIMVYSILLPNHHYIIITRRFNFFQNYIIIIIILKRMIVMVILTRIISVIIEFENEIFETFYNFFTEWCECV